jgi:hypothetical protein
MEAIIILRRLWARRFVVAAFFLIACLVGVSMSFHLSTKGLGSKQYEVGMAMTRILVDTPDSEVIDVNPYGIDDIGGRAQILANLMTSPAVETLIARNAGISPSQLVASTPPVSGPAVPSQMSQTIAKSTNPANTYSLTLFTSALPIIQVESQAPTAAAAARLANGAYAGLRQYLARVATNERVPERRQLVISPLGSAQSATVTAGTGKAIGIVVGLVVFVIFCVLLLVIEGMIRGWRVAAADQRHEDAPASDEASIGARLAAELEAPMHPAGVGAAHD